jgi:hypothetical protein
MSCPRELEAIPAAGFLECEKVPAGWYSDKVRDSDIGWNKPYSPVLFIYLSTETYFHEHNFSLRDGSYATFKDAFKNPFVYEFLGSAETREERQQRAKILKNPDPEAREKEFEEFHARWFLDGKKQMYDLIYNTIEVGEFVERYRVWHDHFNFVFGPPTSEEVIDLEDLLHLPLTKNSRGIDERHKITIIKSRIIDKE